eukprot:7877280-Lingulodinium_polyedra.AAC.1
MLRGVRWPRPVRLDPKEVPEERRNYACVHGASIRSRQFGARGCHAGPSGAAGASSAKAGGPFAPDGRPVPPPKGS